MNDEKLTKLIQKAIGGDTAAFEQLMREKATRIVYASMKVLRNPQDGEDAAQEAMLKMYQHIRNLKDPGAFNKWMYQIITRTCIDLERKKIKEEYDYLEMRSDELSEMRREFLPQEYIEDVDKQKHLMEIIDELPEFHRASLLMFYYEGLSYQEISEILGISEKTVSNTLFRAKQKIKRRLEAEQGKKLTTVSLPALATLPVLGQAFQMEATQQVTPELTNRIIAHLCNHLETVALGTTAAAGSQVAQTAQAAQTTQATQTAQTLGQTAGTAAGQGSASVSGGAVFTTTTKVMVGIVAAATVGGAAYGVLHDDAAHPALAASPPAVAETVILTLEDMIGEEAATELRAFANAGGEPLAWEEFLANLPLTVLHGAQDGTFEYSLLQMSKQDKQLLVLQRTTSDELAVTFHFTDIEETPPSGPQLLTSFQRWGQ